MNEIYENEKQNKLAYAGRYSDSTCFTVLETDWKKDTQRQFDSQTHKYMVSRVIRRACRSDISSKDF